MEREKVGANEEKEHQTPDGSSVVFFELLAPRSKRKAFYRIWLEREGFGSWKVIKESGIGEQRKRVLDRREWMFDDLRSGLRFLFRKVNGKLNRPEEHPRRYVLITAR